MSFSSLPLISSIVAHYKTVITDIHLYVQGEVPDTVGNTDWVQLKVECEYNELPGGVYDVELPFGFTIGTSINSSNIYQEDINMDKVLSRLSDIGCDLKLSNIETKKFGQINKNINFLQAVITGSYYTTKE